MSHPISPKLVIRRIAGSEKICCTDCGHVLAPSGQPWKRSSIVSRNTDGQIGLRGDNRQSGGNNLAAVCL